LLRSASVLIQEREVHPGTCIAWISAAEGEKFAQVIRDIVEETKKLGPLDRSKLRYKASERFNANTEA